MVEWVTRGLVVTQFITFFAKIFGVLSASWWLVLAPGFALIALIAFAFFMVSVVYND